MKAGVTMNNKQLAQAILDLLQGKENIIRVTNCITRMRVTVNDRTNIDREEIKQLDGVMGIIDDVAIQFVLGPGKVTKETNKFTNKIRIDSNSEEEFNLADSTKSSYKQ